MSSNFILKIKRKFKTVNVIVSVVFLPWKGCILWLPMVSHDQNQPQQAIYLIPSSIAMI